MIFGCSSLSSMHSPKYIWESILCIAAIVNITFTIFVYKKAIGSGLVTLKSDNDGFYSYAGEDFPVHYPFNQLPIIGMTLQETVHYSLNGTDDLVEAEWTSLLERPQESGRTRLGPQHRLFVMTFYHQLHCLFHIHRGLVSTNPMDVPHLQHCLNYLRQTFLCMAADSLEEGDFMGRDYEQERIGDTLVCHDWEMVYSVLDENFDRWVEWREQWD